jgi:SAM-dependent methyltransferase
MNNYKFAVDVFPNIYSRRIESISGWFMPEEKYEYSIQAWVNEEPTASFLQVHRFDVASTFNKLPQAVKSGFMGDVVIPDTIKIGEKFTLAIKVIFSTGELMLAKENLVLLAEHNDVRVRKIEFGDILQDPNTGQSVSLNKEGYFVSELNVKVPTSLGVPNFYPGSKCNPIRLTEKGLTHPYNSIAQKLIDDCGLVLDFGCGIQAQDRLRDNVINLDAIQFPYVDVINSYSTLPFKDEKFDAVISQAVFEHLPNPFESAKEVFRVLRQGGYAYIDTAFMQPFHGDPDHYFNMTVSGLKKIMEGFEIIEIGVRPYQNPSRGLIMQINAIMPFLSNKLWSDYLNEALRILEVNGDNFDSSIGVVGRELLAAGVYVLARKPLG